jgi:hypothetical protein
MPNPILARFNVAKAIHKNFSADGQQQPARRHAQKIWTPENALKLHGFIRCEWSETNEESSSFLARVPFLYYSLVSGGRC